MALVALFPDERFFNRTVFLSQVFCPEHRIFMMPESPNDPDDPDVKIQNWFENFRMGVKMRIFYGVLVFIIVFLTGAIILLQPKGMSQVQRSNFTMRANSSSTNSSTPAPIPQATVTLTTRRDKVAEEIALYQKSLRDMILVKRLLAKMSSTTRAQESDPTTTNPASDLPADTTSTTPFEVIASEPTTELIFEEEELTVVISEDETTYTTPVDWRAVLDQAISANLPTNDS